jgi:ankyrin repeat protein
LVYAAQHGHSDIVKLLLHEHAEINAQDKVSKNFCYNSTACNVVIQTVCHGTQNGCTALMWAAKEGYLIAVELLLDAKADFNLRNLVSIQYRALES